MVRLLIFTERGQNSALFLKVKKPTGANIDLDQRKPAAHTEEQRHGAVAVFGADHELHVVRLGRV
jgi:hypothetical protein